MKVWIWTDVIAGETRVFSSEEKMWDTVLAIFREEDDWTLDEVKERVTDDTGDFEILVCEVK